jgi:predicted molibdopterin-dependent oxidoreductase YjgC
MPGSDGTIISSMTTCGDCVQACVANAAVKAAARYADRIMSSLWRAEMKSPYVKRDLV